MKIVTGSPGHTELKECEVKPPVLAYPSIGPEAGEFILDTDASTEKGA